MREFTAPPYEPGEFTTNCRSCDAEIYFRPTSKGNKMPMSVASGRSHFEDCPNAAKHRKQRESVSDQKKGVQLVDVMAEILLIKADLQEIRRIIGEG